MSLSPDTVTGSRFRHRVKDIKLEPFQSKYPIELELLVDKDKTIKLPRIAADKDLYWDLGLLPCVVNNESEVVVKLVEVHSFKDRIGSAAYKIPDVNGQSVIVRDARIVGPHKKSSFFTRFSHGQDHWNITIRFLEQKELDVAYSESIKKSSTAIQNTVGFNDRLGNAGHVFKTILGFGAVVAELHPAAKLIVELVTKTWGILEKQQQLHDDMKRLIKGLDRILPVVQSVKEHSRERMLQDTISKLLDLVEDTVYFIKMYLSKPELARAIYGAFDGEPGERLDELMKELEDCRSDFDTRISAEILKLVFTGDQLALIESLRWRDQLHVSNSSRCDPGTRVKLLDEIHEWTSVQKIDQKLLWLKGDTGLGKSAIAGSVCRRLDSDKTLGAYFFCKRDDPKRRDPDIVLNTLIFRLAKRYKAYGRLVASLIESDKELPNASMEQLYTNFIQQPLQRLKDNGDQPDNTLIVVVDALDECDRGTGPKALHTYLRELSQLVPWLKVLVTSRPDPDIDLAYRSYDADFVFIYNVRQYDASDDILTFIERRTSAVALEQQREGWSAKSCVLLAERANGLFIWAETACKFIEGGNDMESDLKNLLDGTQSASGTLQLDSLYTSAIERGMGSEREENVRAMQWLLGVILATNARTPLSRSGIKSLLEGFVTPGSVDSMMRRLGSVLYEDSTISGAVRAYHQSFADFLADERRSGRFFVHPEEQNKAFGERCINIMLNGLRFNICELETSHKLNREVPELEARVRSAIGEDLRYSCLHWSSHLDKGVGAAPPKVLDNFLFGPELLYWIEVLSLLGELRVGLSSLQQVSSWTSDRQSRRNECAEDAYRFVQSFYEAISESTPHLYVSALALAPKESGMALCVRDMYPNRVKTTEGGSEKWSSWLKTIAHAGKVFSVAISVDGKRIASSAEDKTVRIWDAETGQPVSTPLQGHSGHVCSVAFSSDGKCIVSGSQDKTVRIWDAETGQPASAPLQGHSDWVRSVAFPSDGKRIVSGSDDKTVRIWDAETGEPASAPLQGHSGSIFSVAFSSDGKRIVSGSDDHTVRIWDAETGQSAFAPLQGHSGYVYSVAFSSDGKRIVSGSEDKTVRIWDAETGQSVFAPLRGHSSSVYSVASTSDGNSIVSGSLDTTIRTWNIEAALTSFSSPSCSLYSFFDIPNPSDSASHTKSNPTSHPASKDLCLAGYQLVPYLLPGTGWVSVDSQILLWLPSECRQIDHSLIRISNTPLPSPLLLDVSQFVHGDQWARIVG